MYSFKNDYSDGGHPQILEALSSSSHLQADGYGEDQFCLEAKEIILDLIDDKSADVHFLVGGTQTNLIAISSFLRPHEAVICVNEGHIFVHETGAIEATGHKVLTVDSEDGKITVEKIEPVLNEHYFEHMVKPKMVYISQSTECGTLYSLKELQTLSEFCKKNDLYLYVDGARLGSALTATCNDITLKDLANLSDAFYIGGTKNGALFGEALVISKNELKSDFRYFIKQKGAMLAKGRLLGIQFLTLLKDGLYFDLAKHANYMAEKLQSEIMNLGFKVKFHSYTNQIFPIFPKEIVEELEKKYRFFRWEENSKGVTIRLICSWNSNIESINNFISYIKSVMG